MKPETVFQPETVLLVLSLAKTESQFLHTVKTHLKCFGIRRLLKMGVEIYFVVFKKAFDSIGRETMFETLRSGGDTNENVPS